MTVTTTTRILVPADADRVEEWRGDARWFHVQTVTVDAYSGPVPVIVDGEQRDTGQTERWVNIGGIFEYAFRPAEAREMARVLIAAAEVAERGNDTQ